MNLRQLEHVVLLTEELSFQRAADRACISVSAFSRSIAAIEDDLGVRLFDRGPRSVQITSIGERVIARAREVLNKADDMSTEAARLGAGETGTVDMGIVPGLNMALMPDVVQLLRRQNPQIQLNIHIDTRDRLQSMLANRRIEFMAAYTYPQLNADGVVVDTLGNYYGGLYCRAGHELARPGQATPQQMQKARFASPHISQRAAWQISRNLGFEPKALIEIALMCDDGALLVDAVLGSDLVLIALEALVRRQLEAGTLVRVPLDMLENAKMPSGDPKGLRAGLMRTSDRTLLPASECVYGLIRQVAAGH